MNDTYLYVVEKRVVHSIKIENKQAVEKWEKEIIEFCNRIYPGKVKFEVLVTI